MTSSRIRAGAAGAKPWSVYDARMGWTLLAMAAIFGCICNCTLASTEGCTKPWPSAVCAVALLLYAVCLSKAMQLMPMGVAYATYASVVIIVTMTVGFYIYHQRPNRSTALGVACIVAGISILHTAGKPT